MCKNLKELKEKLKKVKGKLSKLDYHSVLIGIAGGVILTTAVVVGYKIVPSKGVSSNGCNVNDQTILKAVKLLGLDNAEIIKKENENGICVFYVKAKRNGWTYEFTMPVMDKYLILQGIDLSSLPKDLNNPLAMFSIKKVGVNLIKQIPPKFEPNVTQTPPKVNLFIMSNCPFGVPVAEEFAKLIKEGKLQFELNPRYILSTTPMYQGQKGYKIGNTTFYSLHGPAEALQDAVEKCVYYVYGQKGWAEFVLEVAKLYKNNELKENPEERLKQLEEIAKKLGFDWNKIDNCLKTKAEQLLKEDIELENKLNAQASPTIYINGVQYYGNRTAKAFAEAICKSYAKCNETILNEVTKNINETNSTNTPSAGSCNPK